METVFIFNIIILILSVVAHELAHGYAAEHQGDPTARLAGRLTMNPLSHMDLMGSFIVPVLLSLIPGGIVFGWAKPVPYNPYNLKNQRWGEVWVAAAGPLTNVFIALVFGLIIRFNEVLSLSMAVIEISSMVVFINILLAVFNMIPIPPLDGSKVLFGFLSYKYNYIKEWLSRNSIFILLFFILFLWRMMLPVVFLLFGLFTGIDLG
ncbi:site-2 protease family protein [Candidatus Wolfebacteria bacterium]|nr:MAG: site-2 protease family protein [Candidatus Wolfebacteria bacterium]